MIIDSYARFLPSAAKRSLLHIGAHVGEEAGRYEQAGFEVVQWVEADPRIFVKLQENLRRHDPARQQAFMALITRASGGKRRLYRYSNEGASNSVYHASELFGAMVSSVCETGDSVELDEVCLDDFVARHGLQPGALVIDVQGAELEVLTGGPHTLAAVVAIEVEVSKQRLYEGGALFEEVDALLRVAGFARVTAVPWHGDVLYVRPASLSSAQRIGLRSLGMANHCKQKLGSLRRAVRRPGEFLRRFKLRRAMGGPR